MSVHRWIADEGRWEDPWNWDTGRVPGKGDEARIENGGLVMIGADTLVEAEAILIEGRVGYPPIQFEYRT